MKNILIKVGVAVAFVAMITVNYLSNSLPINGRTPGEISDSYPNLFAPAGITFSIWGLIYLWLGAYVIYQFVRLNREYAKERDALLEKVNLLFIATSFANVAWIFAWHYDYIGISLVVMFVLLGLLIKIADILHSKPLTVWNKFFVTIPFSLYFGWIIVATIANVVVFLVSVGYRGFWLPEFVLTILVILIGAVIGILRIQKDRNVIYGLVLMWAYFGILIKHISEGGWDRQYPSIIATVILCLGAITFSVVRIVYVRSRMDINN